MPRNDAQAVPNLMSFTAQYTLHVFRALLRESPLPVGESLRVAYKSLKRREVRGKGEDVA